MISEISDERLVLYVGNLFYSFINLFFLQQIVNLIFLYQIKVKD